ncbi:MAG: hypothetical protein DRP18_02455 [Candidatus Aenigmatarchaeota archaeon]|nr:MAG: hypothetical protein DRP18_02455 [Candidatus Aenigmarchaeota archaeon]
MEINMEREEMTSLDFRFLVQELKGNLVNGIIRRIYQYEKKKFFFEIFVPTKGSFWLYADAKKMFLTQKRKPAPQEPPSFCMFLRKHLLGKKIKYIKQYEFDRIIEIEINGYILIFELIHPGNVILCDSFYNIIMPLEIQRWRHREIKPKTVYRYPPRIENPFEMDLNDFLRKLKSNPDKKIVSLLSSNLSFGSIYGNEICAVAGVNKDKPCKDISLDEASRIHKVIEVLKETPLKPVVYAQGAFPFPLKILENEKPKEVQDFCQALDEFFSEKEEEKTEQEAKKEVLEKEEKIERIFGHQKEAETKWERIEKDSRDSAERIYNYYETVRVALEGIRKARETGMSWSEIKNQISQEPTPEAEAIKEIREGDGIIVLDLGGKEVEIDIRKTVEENAEKYYEDAKWARKKLEGVKEAEKQILEKIEETKEKPEEKTEKEKPKKRKKWYENFRWFFSSDGFLVVAGKNDESNETLIKKHTEDNDIVFHADIPGAAFVVIKSQGLDVPDETKKEAAEFAAAYSKAWSKGLGTIDVYSVPGSRVTKGGVNLPKGSFIIEGEREWYREQEIKLSIGVKIKEDEADVVSGPVMAVRKNSDYFVTIKPGFKQSLELAMEIKNKLLIKAKPEDKPFIENIPLEEFQKRIPSGMGEIVEYGV